MPTLWGGPLKQLALSGNNLSGSIPSRLGNLRYLVHLNLNGNRLSGSIPQELGNLTLLETLYLNNNQLTGEIPNTLGSRIYRIEVMYIHNNSSLQGCIPRSLESVTGIDRALGNRGGTNLAGFCSILELEKADIEIAEKSVLLELYFETNGQKWLGIDGATWDITIPLRQWDGVTTNQEGRVTELWLGGKNLVGGIPSSLGQLEMLTYLDLSRNRLTGEIPRELASLKNLGSRGVHLYGNQFDRGCSPYGLKQKFAASFNARPADSSTRGFLTDVFELIGSLLPAEASLAITEVLNQSGLKGFIDELAKNTPEKLKPGNFKNTVLERQSLAGDNTGAFKRFRNIKGFGNFLDIISVITSDWFIRWVRGSGENNHGLGVPPCPPSMEPYPPKTPLAQQSLASDRTALLAVREYYLDGDRPNRYENERRCPNLFNPFATCERRINEEYFQENWPGDNIRHWDGVKIEGGRVTGLSLAGTWKSPSLLEGGIPPEVGDLGALKKLNLSRNRLSGEIPPQLGNLVNLTTLALTQQSDKCGPNYTSLPEGVRKDCAAERLSGNLPEHLGNLVALSDLIVHENDFEGIVPPELGNAQGLNQVNFSDSGLRGCIPTNLQEHYGTPVIGQFLAEVSHIVAWSVGSTAFPVVGAVVSTIDFLTSGKISSLTGFVIKGIVRFTSELFKDGSRDSDFGGVKLYCE